MGWDSDSDGDRVRKRRSKDRDKDRRRDGKSKGSSRSSRRRRSSSESSDDKKRRHKSSKKSSRRKRRTRSRSKSTVSSSSSSSSRRRRDRDREKNRERTRERSRDRDKHSKSRDRDRAASSRDDSVTKSSSVGKRPSPPVFPAEQVAVPAASTPSVNAVREIEELGFTPKAFVSSRTKRAEPVVVDLETNGDFGTAHVKKEVDKPEINYKEFDPEGIVHPNMFADPAEKEARWLKRLISLRQRFRNV